MKLAAGITGETLSYSKDGAPRRVSPSINPVFAGGLPAGRLSRRQVAALVGGAPFNRDSGRRTGARAVWGGRAPVRQVLSMAAGAGVRCNPDLKSAYAGVPLGRTSSVPLGTTLALVACMRRLNSILKTRQPWTAGTAA